jgi:uncharacterized protein Veg
MWRAEGVEIAFNMGRRNQKRKLGLFIEQFPPGTALSIDWRPSDEKTNPQITQMSADEDDLTLRSSA